jgi:predicted aconitase
MHLTKKENEMLEGKHGYPVQKSMEILFALGECYEAEKMIPIASAHIGGSRAINGKAGALFIGEMADKGGKFVVFTDTNPSSIEPLLWKDIGISEETTQEQMAMTSDFTRMDAFLGNTCTPYLIGNVPLMGQHISWTESSAIIFANSALGARTNREADPVPIAAALAGRVPAYGYHLDQNRFADLKISVKAYLKDIHDYGTLGYFTGKVAKDKVPVLSNLSPSVSWNELEFFGAAAATSGSVALYHIVGVTPEAPTEEAALGTKRMVDLLTFEFGEKELRETEESLCKATTEEVDIVILGCPHASIGEIRAITQHLSGKKLNSGVEFWVLTSQIVRTYAEKMGYVNAIEKAGGRVMCDTCPINMTPGLLKRQGHQTLATNSAKMAYYIIGVQGLLPYYGSTQRCIEAAMIGKWR